HPRWRFVFVSHETLNPAFVPTQYGAVDAATLVGVDVRWTGSASADLGETLAAFRSAVSGKADAIAVSVIDRSAFESPIKQALGLVLEKRYGGQAHGGRLRRAPAHAGARPQGSLCLHRRPAALPAGVLSRLAALSVQALGRPDRAGERRHRLPVRDEGRGRAL